MTKLPTTAVLGAILALAACQIPQQRGPLGPTLSDARSAYPPGYLAQANRLVDRFEADRRQEGMIGVSADIANCYRATTRPYVQVNALRECMILDNFAVKFDQEMARRYGVGGGIPFFSFTAFSNRLQRFGQRAGFTDGEVLGGYLGQGASTMFAVLADRRRQ